MPRVEVPGAPADLADRGSSLRGASIPTSPPDLRRQFSAMLDLRGSSLAVPAAKEQEQWELWLKFYSRQLSVFFVILMPGEGRGGELGGLGWAMHDKK